MKYAIVPGTGTDPIKNPLQVYEAEDGGDPHWYPVPSNRIALHPDTSQVFVKEDVAPYRDGKWMELPTPSKGPVVDTIRNIATGLTKGIGTAWDTMMEAGRAMNQGMYNDVGETQKALANAGLPVQPGPVPQAGTTVMPGAVLPHTMPSGLDVENYIFRKAGDAGGQYYYNPSSGWGRTGQTAVQMGTAGGMMGGPAAIVPGMIGGAAQQVTAEAGLPQPAQIAAGFVAPLAAHSARVAIRPGAERTIAQIVNRLTPQQIDAAHALRQDALAAGTNLTWPEAIADVTGGGARALLSIQRVIEQSTGGSRILDDYMAQRVAGNQTAWEQQANQFGPPLQGLPGNDIPTDLQTAAVNSVAAARRNRFNQTDPHYRAGENDVVPAADLQAVLARVDAAIARAPSDAVIAQLRQFRNDLLMPGPHRGQAPQQKQQVGQLDSVVKQWRSRIDAGERPGQLSDNALANETVAVVGPILTDLRDSMTRASMPHAYGRYEHGRISEEAVNPLQRSPVGKLKKAAPDLAVQRQVVAPLGEQGVLNPQTVRFTVQQLQQHGRPGVVRDWVRANLDSLFSESTQDNVAGANQWGGAKFRAAIAGNGQQAANLEAMVTSLPNGQAIWNGLDRLLAIYRAQGRRQAPGSMTEFNRQITEQIGGGKINVQFISRFQDAIDRWRYNGRADRLAALITDPNNLDRWRALALGRPRDAIFALGMAPQPQAQPVVPALGTTNLFGVPQQFQGQ